MQHRIVPRPYTRATCRFDVEIASIACVVPPHKVTQDAVAEGAKRFFPHLTGLLSVFANTGIESRFVAEPPEWYLEDRGRKERTASFQRHALALLEQATLEAVADAGIELDDIGAVVTNTITGLAIPSLEARLLNRLPFCARSSACRSSGSAAGAASAGLPAPCASHTPCPAATCFSSRSICAACAHAAMT